MKVPFHCTGSLYPKCTSQEIATVGRNMFFWNFYVLLILGEGMGAGLLQRGRQRVTGEPHPVFSVGHLPLPETGPGGRVCLAAP